MYYYPKNDFYKRLTPGDEATKKLPSVTICPWSAFKSGNFFYDEEGFRRNTFNLGKNFQPR
jgi:hypothetical protein